MIFWILFLLLILLGIWFCIEQHVLRVRKQMLSLEHLPAGWDGVSLLQITDLHHRQMGRGNCRIIRQAQQLQPDVIVLTGDMISRDMRDLHKIFAGTFENKPYLSLHGKSRTGLAAGGAAGVLGNGGTGRLSPAAK